MQKIGQMAQQAGVSVQTLRHYDKIGLLPPSATTAAGYRLYSDADRQRLELIRTLRDVGFDLAAIELLLRDATSVEQGIALQLAAIETQMRALSRQRLILRTVQEGASEARLKRLKRLNVLARLNRLEKEAFLAQQLRRAEQESLGGEAIWKAAVSDLPETMNEEQLEAWLDLAELASDPSFQAALQRQLAPMQQVDSQKRATWEATLGEVSQQMKEACHSGLSAESEVGQALIAQLAEAFAEAQGKAADAEFDRWLLDFYERNSDPRFADYWRLMRLIKSLPEEEAAGDVAQWLLAGLRFRAAR